MKICWLDIAASYSHASLALPALHAASAPAASADWQVVAATIKDDAGAVATRVILQNPDVLAATGYLFTRDFMLRVVRRVKAACPTCRVILGGPEFLGDNNAFLQRETAVTAVFRGEGEVGFGQWLERLDTPEEWGSIVGLCWRDAAGVCRDNGLAIIESWEQMPAPATSRFFGWAKPFVQLETTRGCPHRCRFCTSSRFGALRCLPLDRVRADLTEFRRHAVHEVRVLDRTFNANPARAGELLHIFLAEFPEMRFHLEVHPAFLPGELRTALAAAPPGRLHLEVGLQTTCPAAHEACRRGGTPDASWAGLDFLCGCRNLAVHVDLLAGLPGLSLDHMLGDLHRVLALQPDEVQLEILKVLPGTAFRDEADVFGLAFAPDPPYEVLRTPQMSVADLETVRQLSAVLDQYANHPALREIFQGAMGRTPHRLLEFIESLRHHGLGIPTALEKRFRLLHAFLTERDADAAGMLAVAWLRAGLSPAHGLGQTEPWKAAIPPDAELVEGQADMPRQGVHVWLLRGSGWQYWFVFDRAIAHSRPVAVFRRRTATHSYE